MTTTTYQAYLTRELTEVEQMELDYGDNWRVAPYQWIYTSIEEFIQQLNKLQPGYSLSLEIQKYDDREFDDSLIDDDEYYSYFTEEGEIEF